jgi:hypothetical protein
LCAKNITTYEYLTGTRDPQLKARAVPKETTANGHTNGHAGITATTVGMPQQATLAGSTLPASPSLPTLAAVVPPAGEPSTSDLAGREAGGGSPGPPVSQPTASEKPSQNFSDGQSRLRRESSHTSDGGSWSAPPGQSAPQTAGAVARAVSGTFSDFMFGSVRPQEPEASASVAGSEGTGNGGASTQQVTFSVSSIAEDPRPSDPWHIAERGDADRDTLPWRDCADSRSRDGPSRCGRDDNGMCFAPPNSSGRSPTILRRARGDGCEDFLSSKGCTVC